MESFRFILSELWVLSFSAVPTFSQNIDILPSVLILVNVNILC